MGVYIKGMEMPKSPVLLCIHPDGKVFADLVGGWREYKAVPVPPHGDLIERDALMKEFEEAQRTMEKHGREYSCSFMSSSQEISTEWYCVEDMLENAPTIIPAEEGET